MKMKRKHLANVLCIAVLLTAGISCSNNKEKTEAERKENDLWYKQQIEQDIASGRDLNLPLPEGRNQYTHLHEAALGDYIESAKMLISKGVNVDPRDRTDATPLHRAVQTGSVQIAKLLIENGANIEAKDKSGESPLFWAYHAPRNQKAIIQLLLDSGAKHEIQDKYGTTPFMMFASFGNTVAMAILLEKGVDVNHVNKTGYTALHLAAWDGHDKAVRILLENDAEVNLISETQKTPLDCALIPLEWKEASPWGKRKSVSLIKKHGGKKASELKTP